MRLDPSIDGDLCFIDEHNFERLPLNPDNPYGNAVRMVPTRLKSEKEGARHAAPGRTWRICSAHATNTITKKPTAFKLVPATRGGMQPLLLTDPTSSVSKRGAFATRALWVTRRNSAQKFPAGDFPTQATGEDGVQKWIESDQDINGVSLTIWHSFGVLHSPRVEDFPVMPCESVGFSLKPDGFFLGNPALDLPPDRDVRSVNVATSNVLNGNGRCCS